MATEHPEPEHRLPPGWLARDETKHLVLAELTSRKAQRRKRNRRIVASGAVLLTVSLLGFFVRERWTLGRNVAATVAVMSPLRTTLPDGSVIEHRPGSTYTVDFSRDLRHVVLTRGTAHFTVTKNSERPFVVTASGMSVRAVGTAFSIECNEDALEILVTEGRVAVAPVSRQEPGTPTTVEAGKGVRVELEQGAPSRSPNLQPVPTSAFEAKLAWRTKMVEFSGTPLGEAVRILNEHNRIQFSISDGALAELRLSGVIRADRVSGVVSFLEGEGVEVERLSDTEIVLRQARAKK